MKKNHEYYYQMESQMLVTDIKFCHFYVWTMSKKNKINQLWFVLKRIKFFAAVLKQSYESPSARINYKKARSSK